MCVAGAEAEALREHALSAPAGSPAPLDLGRRRSVTSLALPEPRHLPPREVYSTGLTPARVQARGHRLHTPTPHAPFQTVQKKLSVYNQPR
eukprot:2530814-Rhodomonas_salina.6